MKQKPTETEKEWISRLTLLYEHAYTEAGGVHEQARAVFDAAAMLSASVFEEAPAPAVSRSFTEPKRSSSSSSSWSSGGSGSSSSSNNGEVSAYCGCPCSCWQKFDDDYEGCGCDCTIETRNGGSKPCGCRLPRDGMVMRKEGRKRFWVDEYADQSADDLPFQ